MVNNNTNYALCRSNPQISIFDFMLINPDFRLFGVWEIPKEYQLLSDLKMILLK